MPVREIFADTAGWANYFVRSQPLHKQARELLVHSRASRSPLITTNYVVTELASLLITRLRTPKPVLVSILQAIETVSWVEVVHVDTTLDEEAWRLFKERSDKEWSLVDCASFAVMRRLGGTHALTTDRHFEQAGFVRLLN